MGSLPVPFRIVLEGEETEVIEKKSRFIGNMIKIDSEEDAQKFIQNIRKKYYDAKHHCYAYRLFNGQLIEKFSDDGEPAQTAGLPMIEVLRKKDIYQVCIVSSRYFGGTLLGTGGLIRAYTECVLQTIECSKIIEKTTVWQVTIICNYTDFGKIQYLVTNEPFCTIQNIIYTDRVSLNVIVPLGKENVSDNIKALNYNDIIVEEKTKLEGYMLAGEFIIG